MKHSHTVTIRMGAAHWDVTVDGVGTFDLRKMDRTQRGQFHGTFMASIRKVIRNRKAV